MNYIIKEFQTNNGTTAEVPIALNDPSDLREAESKFHTVLANAAVSNVQEHAAVILTQDGRIVRSECYKHYSEPAEQSEEN